MNYDIIYTGIFLDKSSTDDLIDWFKLKRKTNLLKKVCSDVAPISIVKDTVPESFLSNLNIGEEVRLEVVGFMDKDDIQIVICTVLSNLKKLKNKFLKIVISTSLKSVNLAKYNERKFIECNGPTLYGNIGFINYDKEIILSLSDEDNR